MVPTVRRFWRGAARATAVRLRRRGSFIWKGAMGDWGRGEETRVIGGQLACCLLQASCFHRLIHSFREPSRRENTEGKRDTTSGLLGGYREEGQTLREYSIIRDGGGYLRGKRRPKTEWENWDKAGMG